MDERRASFLDRLALEVIAQAIRDARRGNPYAAFWLETIGYTWLDAYSAGGVDRQAWEKYIAELRPGKGMNRKN